MLFETARHEALHAQPWDAAVARDAIVAIVDTLERSRDAGGGWPVHPLDADEPPPASGYKSLYFGSAGVLWALWYLQRAGAVTLAADPREGLDAVEAAYRAAPDTGHCVPSYFLGEVGIELVRWCLTGDAGAAERMHAAIEANIPNPTNEALWAAPGTMVAAWHMWTATGEPRWRALFMANVGQVWRTWLPDPHAGCHLWTQDLYGRIVQLLGAGHGFAGNVYPLLKAAGLLDAERRETLYGRCLETLGRTELREGDASNWPPGVGAPRPGRAAVLMQWCHGAPGIVSSLREYPLGIAPEMDALLLRAGEAVWRAGPLAKGPGLCHGTAGNGYALLALHERTGDPVWLERARVFAMHAALQSARMRAAYGQIRPSLWTGDAGVAVFLWHCVQGTGGLPGLDLVA